MEMSATPVSPELGAYFRGSTALAHVEGFSVEGAGIEDLWLTYAGRRLHVDLYRTALAKASVVFQPGVGSYARFYAPLCQALVRAGYNVLAIDRPGHGYSEGERGDCTIAEATAVTGIVIEAARQTFGLPVILIGSGLGGLITGCSVLAGLKPDLAIAQNFVLPGPLLSLRLRGRFIERFRKRPYDISHLANGFRSISGDAALITYLKAKADPQAAWTQSARAVASLFRYHPPKPLRLAAPLVLISGTRDRIIPASASRWFGRWSGLRDVPNVALRDAGHMLFHDHLAQTMAALLPLMSGVTSGARNSTTATAPAD